MKKLYLLLVIATLAATFSGCNDWMDKKPKSMITDDQVWNDPSQLLSLIANYYDRMPTLSGLEDKEDGPDGNKSRLQQWRNMADFDDAMWSGYTGENWRNQQAEYNYDYARYWDYILIRDINLAIDNIEEYSTELSATTKTNFINELRFIRAFVYFEMVKRMGGVPLITTQLEYNFDNNPEPLRVARSKEYEVYDFIADEIDEIKDALGNKNSITRANKYIALALKSRAMLYAASIAKYNNQMPVPIRTENEEVGIPASMANSYYQKSLEASKEIIGSGMYSLFDGNPADDGDNFFKMLISKSNNKEMIFVKDYLAAKDKRHGFAYDNIARSVREDNLGSSAVTPSLNLVESFEYLNGTSGELKTKDVSGNYIFYENMADIFADRDPRLYGTVVYPGSVFRGIDIKMQAGIKVWNGSGYDTMEADELGKNHTDGGILTGAGGPHRSIQEVSGTGFYMRKLISDAAGASTRGIRSENWWPWFRLGEIYLNAAEAALELNDEATAKNYVNTLREERGFPANSINTLTIEKLRNERRVELAFEDHRYFDAKRWRIAHILWNGDSSNTNAVLYALYPYRVIHPGSTNNGKYVFDKMVAPRFTTPRNFRMGNYYSSIKKEVLESNPKLIPNPFH